MRESGSWGKGIRRLPLTVDEAAAVMRVAPATVDRDWALARAWLFRELGGERR